MRPFLPVDSLSEFLGNVDHLGRHNTLLLGMLHPFEPHREPETIDVDIAGKVYLVFPKVASLFVLHDLTMKASAETVPLETFDDPSQHSMYWAALVLYYVDPDLILEWLLTSLKLQHISFQV